MDGFRLPPLEALKGGGVLAVDRQEEPSTPLSRSERELTRRDEAFLVRESEGDAPLERPEGRRQAGKADDRVQDDVGRRVVQQGGRIPSRLDMLDTVFGRERRELARTGG